MQFKGFRRAGLTAAVTAISLMAFGASAASAVPPKVFSTSFSHVTSTSVVLEASINPEGRPVAYQFEYGLSDCISGSCTTSPALEGFLASATTPQAVPPVTLEGLTPGTEYHFRIVVKNGLNEKVEGPDTVFATYPLPPVFGACPNDALRLDRPSGLLPDCRAYEQASPDKNGTDINGQPTRCRPRPMAIPSPSSPPPACPAAIGAQDFRPTSPRAGPGGWSTRASTRPQPPARRPKRGLDPGPLVLLLQDSRLLHRTRTFRSRSSAEDRSPRSPPKPREDPSSPAPAPTARSSTFKTKASCSPRPASGEDNLYVWDRDTGTVSLAGILPDLPVPRRPASPRGAFAGPYEWFFSNRKDSLSGAIPSYYIQNQHAISADGSKAYFTAGGGQLYLREDAAGPDAQRPFTSPPRRRTTARVPAAPTPGTRPAAFMAASTDGSAAFFTSAEKLTDDANTGPEPDAVRRSRRAGIDGTGTTWTSCPPAPSGLIAARATTSTGPNPTVEHDRPRQSQRAETPKKTEETSSPAPATPRTWRWPANTSTGPTPPGKEKTKARSGGRNLWPGGPEDVKQDFMLDLLHPPRRSQRTEHLRDHPVQPAGDRGRRRPTSTGATSGRTTASPSPRR